MMPKPVIKQGFSGFAEKKILFFNDLIRTRFACEKPLRTVVLPGANGRHGIPAQKEI